MSRYGPKPQPPTLKAKRRDITLRCDVEVYAKAQELITYMPGVSLSDLVEDFMTTIVQQFAPLRLAIEDLKAANPEVSREEQADIIDRWFAQMMGQGTLQFARASDAFRSGKENDG